MTAPGIRGSTSVMTKPRAKGGMGRPQVDRGLIFLETWNEFLGESALHGVKYFAQSRWFVKVFWVRKE